MTGEAVQVGRAGDDEEREVDQVGGDGDGHGRLEERQRRTPSPLPRIPVRRLPALRQRSQMSKRPAIRAFLALDNWRMTGARIPSLAPDRQMARNMSWRCWQVPVLRRRNRPAAVQVRIARRYPFTTSRARSCGGNRGAKAAAHLSKPVIRIADEGARTYRPSRARVRVPRRKRGRPDIYLASTFDDEEPELVALARAIRLRNPLWRRRPPPNSTSKPLI